MLLKRLTLDLASDRGLPSEFGPADANPLADDIVCVTARTAGPRTEWSELDRERNEVSRGLGRSPMKIVLNGEPFELAEPLTVGALLAQLRIDPRRVAVEHNLVVLKRATFDDTIVKDGDQVEIVNFVGGG